jgi:hypothetical protein
MYDAGDVDAFNPDYDRYPYFKLADCFDDIVHAGEAVYYPRCIPFMVVIMMLTHI